jgi:hypothetical protein
MPRRSGNRRADLISIRPATLLIAVSFAAPETLLDFLAPPAPTLRPEPYDHRDGSQSVSSSPIAVPNKPAP